MANDIDLPPDLTPQQRVMVTLRRLYRDFSLVWVFAVARTLLQELYQGRLDRYLDPNPRKDDGFAKLLADHGAELADMRLDKATLRSYVRAYEVHCDLPPDLHDAMTASHLVTLASLPGTTERTMMARASVENAWTVDELDAQVAARLVELLGDQPRKGRPRLAEEIKAANAVDRELTWLEELRQKHGSLAHLPLGVKVEVRRRLQGVAKRTHDLLQDLED